MSFIFIFAYVAIIFNFSPMKVTTLTGLLTFSVLVTIMLRPKSDIRGRLLGVFKDAACQGIDYSSRDSATIDQSFKDKVTSVRGSGPNRLREALKSNDPAGYANSFIMPTVIWGVGLVLTFLGFWFCCGCCLCDLCDCCQCCRRNWREDPVTKNGKRRWMIAFAVLGAVMSGVIIGAIIVNGQMINGFKSTICGGALLVDDFVDGTTVMRNGKQAKWIGLKPAYDKLVSLISQVKEAPSKLTSSVAASTAQIDTDYSLMVGRLNQMYSTYPGKSLANPDPTSGDGATVTSPVLQVRHTSHSLLICG
jgi:hypothetical protein